MAKTYNFNGRDLPLKDKASLMESVYWIVTKVPPVQERYKSFVEKFIPDSFMRNQVEEAKETLCYKLMAAEISASGCPAKIVKNWTDSGAYYFLVKATNSTLLPIPAEMWRYERIDWQEQLLCSGYCSTFSKYDEQFDGYAAIEFDFSALLQLFPNPTPEQKQIGSIERQDNMSYKSPYQKFMERVIIEVGINENNQPKKTNIIDWIMKNAPRELAISQNKAQMMATFIRNPETEKGGNKKKG